MTPRGLEPRIAQCDPGASDHLGGAAMIHISDEQVREIADYLTGTCNSIDQALDRLDLEFPVEDVEERLLDVNLERCPICDWWMDSAELVNEAGDVVGCDTCREYQEEN